MTRSAILSPRDEIANRCSPFNAHAKTQRMKTTKPALLTLGHFRRPLRSRTNHGLAEVILEWRYQCTAPIGNV